MSGAAEFGGQLGAEECDGCRLPFLDFQTDFVTHGGDSLCKWCRAVFWTATVLFEQGIEDVDMVVPTLAFAKYATGIPEYDELTKKQGAAQKSLSADLARILLAAGKVSSEMMERAYQGWELVEVVEGGVPFIRALPFSVFTEDHQGTQVLKQVRIQVLSKYAESKTISERYEETLTGRGVRWDDDAPGCISHNFLAATWTSGSNLMTI